MFFFLIRLTRSLFLLTVHLLVWMCANPPNKQSIINWCCAQHNKLDNSRLSAVYNLYMCAITHLMLFMKYYTANVTHANSIIELILVATVYNVDPFLSVFQNVIKKLLMCWDLLSLWDQAVRMFLEMQQDVTFCPWSAFMVISVLSTFFLLEVEVYVLSCIRGLTIGGIPQFVR